MSNLFRILFEFSFFVLLLSLVAPHKSSAQIPKSGIYRLAEPGTYNFNAQHYAKYIQRVNGFYTIETIAHTQIKKYGLSYALVAVDSARKKVRIALLRDTVSTKGKTMVTELKEHQSVF